MILFYLLLGLFAFPLLLLCHASDKKKAGDGNTAGSTAKGTSKGGGATVVGKKNVKSTRLPSVMQPPPMVKQPLSDPKLEQKTQSNETSKESKVPCSMIPPACNPKLEQKTQSIERSKAAKIQSSQCDPKLEQKTQSIEIVETKEPSDLAKLLKWCLAEGDGTNEDYFYEYDIIDMGPFNIDFANETRECLNDLRIFFERRLEWPGPLRSATLDSIDMYLTTTLSTAVDEALAPLIPIIIKNAESCPYLDAISTGGCKWSSLHFLRNLAEEKHVHATRTYRSAIIDMCKKIERKEKKCTNKCGKTCPSSHPHCRNWTAKEIRRFIEATDPEVRTARSNRSLRCACGHKIIMGPNGPDYEDPNALDFSV